MYENLSTGGQKPAFFAKIFVRTQIFGKKPGFFFAARHSRVGRSLRYIQTASLFVEIDIVFKLLFRRLFRVALTYHLAQALIR